jgi:hypothetical protein
MNCTEIRETMPDLAVGLVEPTPEILEHLQTCAPCATQLQEFRQTVALLDEWEAPEPSPYFDTRLQARLREEKAAESARASRWFGWLPRPVLTMAAAVLVAVGVGVVTLQHSPVVDRGAGTNGSENNVSLQRGTAVSDLQTLDSDDDLYANFDVLDDIDSHQAQPTSDN